jgi:hypothetical protein
MRLTVPTRGTKRFAIFFVYQGIMVFNVTTCNERRVGSDSTEETKFFATMEQKIINIYVFYSTNIFDY